MIFQDPLTSLNPVFTIGRQMLDVQRRTASDAEPRGRCAQRAIELLGDVGIPDAGERLGDYPHQFSGGMRQRDHDRDGAAARARAADRRRAHERARRDARGADRRAPAAAAREPRHGDPVRLARPRRRLAARATASSSCTPGAPSSRARPSRSSARRGIRTRRRCSTAVPSRAAARRVASRRSPAACRVSPTLPTGLRVPPRCPLVAGRVPGRVPRDLTLDDGARACHMLRPASAYRSETVVGATEAGDVAAARPSPHSRTPRWAPTRRSRDRDVRRACSCASRALDALRRHARPLAAAGRREAAARCARSTASTSTRAAARCSASSASRARARRRSDARSSASTRRRAGAIVFDGRTP